MDRARTSLLGFTLWTKDDYQANWHHQVLCSYLDRFARGEIKRLIVKMPPRHGKSELVSRRLPAYILGKHPYKQIIGTSYGDSLASQINRDVQRIIDNPSYHQLFPETRLSSDNVRSHVNGIALRNSDVFEVVGRRGSYRSAGIGSGITGHGMDVGIIDDPIKDQKEADSQVYRDRIWEWYTSTFYTRLEKDAQILLTCTSWHEDDLPHRLIAAAKADPDADQWVVVSFPAIREDMSNPEDPRELGHALWEEKYPLSRLMKVMKVVGSRVWNALFQQRPSAMEGNIIKRIHFAEKRFKVWPTQFNEGCISLDATFTGKAKSDHVAIQAWGRINADKYLMDQAFARMDISQTIEAFVKMIARWPKFTARIIENKANGPAIENILKSKISGLILWEPEGDKTTRLNACQPQFEAGNIWVPDDSLAPWADGFIDNICSFPNASDDDRVDACTMALLRLEKSLSRGVGSIRILK